MSSGKPTKRMPRTWVMLIDDSVLNDDIGHGRNKTPDIVKLQHPRTKAGVMFLFSSDNSIVQEVFSLPAAKKTTWFIGDSYIEDGKLYLSTPMDPLFLLLPYLKEAKKSGKVIPLDHLLMNESFPEVSRLLHSSAVKNLDAIADRKGDEDLNAWSYNEEKVMRWLTKKVEAVATVLQEKNIPIKHTSHSDSLISNGESQLNHSKEEYLLYACDIVSEYLSDDLEQMLHTHFNSQCEAFVNMSVRKREECDEDDAQIKKFKRDPSLENDNKSKGKSKTTAKEKKNVAAAAGCKSIASFFKKK